MNATDQCWISFIPFIQRQRCHRLLCKRMWRQRIVYKCTCTGTGTYSGHITPICIVSVHGQCCCSIFSMTVDTLDAGIRTSIEAHPPTTDTHRCYAAYFISFHWPSIIQNKVITTFCGFEWRKVPARLTQFSLIFLIRPRTSAVEMNFWSNVHNWRATELSKLSLAGVSYDSFSMSAGYWCETLSFVESKNFAI